MKTDDGKGGENAIGEHRYDERENNKELTIHRHRKSFYSPYDQIRCSCRSRLSDGLKLLRPSLELGSSLKIYTQPFIQQLQPKILDGFGSSWIALIEYRESQQPDPLFLASAFRGHYRFGRGIRESSGLSTYRKPLETLQLMQWHKAPPEPNDCLGMVTLMALQLHTSVTDFQ